MYLLLILMTALINHFNRLIEKKQQHKNIHLSQPYYKYSVM